MTLEQRLKEIEMIHDERLDTNNPNPYLYLHFCEEVIPQLVKALWAACFELAAIQKLGTGSQGNTVECEMAYEALAEITKVLTK